jgi:hypothetical protein
MTPSGNERNAHYAAWFHELDAWTEYWDVYHPETCGRYYFGDGAQETGLLRCYLPKGGRPPAFRAWVSCALGSDNGTRFAEAVREPAVSAAVLEIDELLGKLFTKYFGNPAFQSTKADYLEATFLFAIDTLPAAPERLALLDSGDPRRRTASRHTLDGDLMWFAWAVHLEAAELLAPSPANSPRRALMAAGIATGCPANFAWRGHRRTRPEYRALPETRQLLRERGLRWAADLPAALAEIRELFRIREWGHT